jgi:hypothetical protein
MADDDPKPQDGQYYTTTVFAPVGYKGAFTVLVMPRRVLDSSAMDSGADFLSVMQLDKEGSPFDSPANGRELALILARFWLNADDQRPPEELVDAAMDTITETPIPVESSPLAGETLQQILSRGGAVGVGTMVAFHVFGATSPLLILAVPGNIILIGAAIGLAKGLENGLAQKIYSLIKHRVIKKKSTK